MNNNIIHKKIKLYRLWKGMSQKEAAAAAGISLSAYQRYERAEREPTYSRAARIAEVLETTPKELWGDSMISD